MRKFSCYIWLLLSAFHSSKSNCQVIDENKFRLYTIGDGLSGNYISGIGQDSAGYMWIATHRGLNRFDGLRFKQFLHTEKYNPVPDNSIYSMNLLPGNMLGIATDDGAQLISTKTLEQKNIFIPTAITLRYWSNACQYISVDDGKNIGVSTKTGFYIFSANGQLKKRYDRYTVKDIGTTWMLFGKHIYKLPDGNMMQLNDEGLSYYDRNTNQIADASMRYPGLKTLTAAIKQKNSLLFFISSYDLLHLNVLTNSFDIIDIRNGEKRSFPASINLLSELGWQTGGTKINDSTWAVNSKLKGFFLLHIDTLKKTITCSGKKYLSRFFCTRIYADRQQRIWVGTPEGLLMQDLRTKTIESFSISSPGIDSLVITSLFFSKDKIFAGTEQKEIYVLDKISKKILARLQLKKAFPETNTVRQFEWIADDTLWIATNSGVHWMNTKNYNSGPVVFNSQFSKQPFIYFLYADHKNNIWIPAGDNALYYYNRLRKTFKLISDGTHPLFKINFTGNMTEDKYGKTWISGDRIIRLNEGLTAIDTLIERLATQQNRKHGYRVMADEQGDVWTLVNDDGFASITGKPVHVRSDKLLFDKNSLIEAALLNDRLYIPTTGGVGYYDIKNENIIVLRNPDGLPEQDITSRFFSLDKTDSSVWFACGNMICRISGKQTFGNASPPFLDFTELNVLNDTAFNYPGEKIKLKYHQNDVRISFSAINYTDAENMRFAYRIKNKTHSTWIDAGTQGSILLTNFSAGEYIIELKVYAYDNKWPAQFREIAIVVTPPFTQTVWFYALAALFLAGCIYLIYRYRVKQIRQKATIEKQLMELEIKGLHAQMNPHFIFNCLNSIQEMILHNQNHQASHYLSKFAQLIRITLVQSTKPFISLQHTIDYLERYIEMEKIRTNEFSYTIEVDDELHTDEIMIPPMLIQPFLENAIWHGAIPGKQLVIGVQFLKQDNRIICIVEDNGKGIDTTMNNKSEMRLDHNSIGIANVQERIQVLNEKYNLNSELSIEDKSKTGKETGTMVKLYFPLKTTTT
jgi:ligand-binding sensor domain-containing protein/two-component sensor histidine kinase